MNNLSVIKQEKHPRYITVYDILLKMINDGNFSEGSRLPGEIELSKMIGVSRSTLRQALSLLKDDGIIKNIQGKGNFILKTNFSKPKGLESFSHPIYKCITKPIDSIEFDFSIQPPNDSIKQLINRNTAIVIMANRWYKSNENTIGHTFTLIPIETISQFNIDLNDKKHLLDFLENTAYQEADDVFLEIKSIPLDYLSNKKYTISSSGYCSLIQETIYTGDCYTSIFNQHYMPLENSSISIHPVIKR